MRFKKNEITMVEFTDDRKDIEAHVQWIL